MPLTIEIREFSHILVWIECDSLTDEFFLLFKDLVKYLLDNGARFVPGRYEAERCVYAALTPSIRDLLREHKANPNHSDVGITLKSMKDVVHATDFELEIVDGSNSAKSKIFHLHRFMLSLRSPAFKMLLQTEWKDMQKVKLKTGEGEMFASVEVAKSIIDFLYSGAVDVHQDDARLVGETLREWGYPAIKVEIEAELKNKDRELLSIVLKSSKQTTLLKSQLSCAYLCRVNELPSQHGMDKLMHDVLLTMESPKGEIYYFACHRALLTHYSAFFYALFNSSFVESEALRNSESGLVEVALTEHKRPELFSQALHFIYTNLVAEQLNADDTLDLLLMADAFLLLELKRLCSAKLRRFVDHSSVFTYLKVAVSHSVPNLKVFCLDYIEKNIKALQQSAEFNEALITSPEDVITELELYRDSVASESPPSGDYYS